MHAQLVHFNLEFGAVRTSASGTCSAWYCALLCLIQSTHLVPWTPKVVSSLVSWSWSRCCSRAAAARRRDRRMSDLHAECNVLSSSQMYDGCKIHFRGNNKIAVSSHENKDLKLKDERKREEFLLPWLWIRRQQYLQGICNFSTQWLLSEFMDFFCSYLAQFKYFMQIMPEVYAVTWNCRYAIHLGAWASPFLPMMDGVDFGCLYTRVRKRLSLFLVLSLHLIVEYKMSLGANSSTSSRPDYPEYRRVWCIQMKYAMQKNSANVHGQMEIWNGSTAAIKTVHWKIIWYWNFTECNFKWWVTCQYECV